MIAFILFSLLSSVVTQRLLQIDDTIDAVELFKAPVDPSNPTSPFGPQIDPPFQKPQSYRIVTRPFSSSINTLQTLSFSLVSTVGVANQQYQIKLDAPYLEVDPWSCADPAASSTGNCRCNTAVADQKYSYTPTIINTIPALGASRITFTVPNWNYLPHAPFPGQDPHARTYRKICYREPGQTLWIDTTVWYAVVKGCLSDTDCQNSATGALYWDGTSPQTLVNTPLTWECLNTSLLGTFWNMGAATLTPAGSSAYTETCWGESREQTLSRLSRKTCCRSGTSPGVCFDKDVHECCGRKPYDSRYEQCCSQSLSRISTTGQGCKCAGNAECPSYAPTCCRLTKYDSSILSLGGVDATALSNWRRNGFCTDGVTTQCCDDGNVFDPSTQKCCRVNGVQSSNTPCPCNDNSQCSSGETCCLQRFPTLWPRGQGLDAVSVSGIQACDKFANWPDGQSPAEVQRCFGKCMDPKFQTCCNGALCSFEYDRCCNNTCCNRFTSTCLEGSRPGVKGIGQRVNPLDFGAAFEVCSAIECFTTRKAFWVFVMPVFWLVATLSSLAIVVVIARRATESVFELTEKAMVFFSVVILFLAIPLFFAPTYKYGVIASFIALFAILAATVRNSKLSFVTILLVVLLLIYWIDPFNGNIYLSLTGGLTPTPVRGATPWASGIIVFIARLQRNPSECTSFYDFFNNDPLAHDFARRFNPNKTTYGYCSRAWLATIVIFSVVNVLAILNLLLLSIFSLTKKLVPKAPKGDVTFEVRPEYNY